MFDTLHKMFMAQYTELWNAVDPIAERIRSLGFLAPGTFAEMSKLTNVKEDTKVPKAQEMIKNVIQGHETVIKTAREIFDVAEKGKDQATMDLLTQRLDVHEKTAWMLRSLLE
jgi:starvation-inducible DNA-binding protein